MRPKFPCVYQALGHSQWHCFVTLPYGKQLGCYFASSLCINCICMALLCLHGTDRCLQAIAQQMDVFASKDAYLCISVNMLRLQCWLKIGKKLGFLSHWT